MKRILFIGVVLVCFSSNISGQAISKSSNTSFSGRIQSLATVEVNGDEIESNTLVRRARLKFEGYALNPKFQYKLELGLTNNDHGSPLPQTKNSARMILDAFVKYEINKNTHLWVGQTKLPGNRERVISSSKLQFVDRSLLNSKYNIDRDMGIQLHHKFIIKDNFTGTAIVSISQGEGRNITTGNDGGFDYTARLELLPFGDFTGKGDYFGSDLKREESPKLSLGFTYDYHDKASRQRGNTGSFLSQSRTLSTLFADMMLKYKGASLMAEYALKSADETPIFYTPIDAVEYFYTGSGINVQAGYLLKSDFEVAARYTVISPEEVIEQDELSMYTLCISRYLNEHKLKIQSDFSIVDEGEEEPSLLGRIQLELSF